MRKATYIALALCAALCTPTMARADEINYLDSFTNGIETLKGETKNEQVTPERDYAESYEPNTDIELNESATLRALPENPTVLDYVTNTVDSYNTNPWGGSTKRGALGFIQQLFSTSSTGFFILQVPIALVFMWWGVRKSKNMIMSAFRKGKANV